MSDSTTPPPPSRAEALASRLARWHARLGPGDRAAWRRCRATTEGLLQPSYPALAGCLPGRADDVAPPGHHEARRAAQLGVLTALALHHAPATPPPVDEALSDEKPVRMGALGAALVGERRDQPRVSEARFRRLLQVDGTDADVALTAIRRTVQQLGDAAHRPPVFADLVSLVDGWHETPRAHLAFAYFRLFNPPSKD